MDTCNTCKQKKRAAEFPAHEHWNAGRNVRMRCSACHSCSKCGRKSLHSNAFDCDNKRCKQCSKAESDQVKCVACEQYKGYSAFPENAKENKTKKRPSVCLECIDNGYSIRSLKRYRCVGCEKERGPGKFTRPDKEETHVCHDCEARKKEIEKKCKKPGAYRCTCPKQEHIHNNEKCGLYRRSAGENVWPGKNKEVTKDDDDFMKRIKRKKRK